jgi:RNA cap guanine-N2 methyltransferase
VLNKDFLKLEQSDFKIPGGSEEKKEVDAIFLSPPWGGTGYYLLKEYSLDHIFPDFSEIIAKSLEFSRNLMLFLPKNTSINELIERLLPFTKQFCS